MDMRNDAYTNILRYCMWKPDREWWSHPLDFLYQGLNEWHPFEITMVWLSRTRNGIDFSPCALFMIRVRSKSQDKRQKKCAARIGAAVNRNETVVTGKKLVYGDIN